MFKLFTRAISKLHKEHRGMTGLETAIILIAFVTVASVLAYSVLSAGIFSAERGKATVYSGLESAQASMGVQGVVIGEADSTNSSLDYIDFLVGLTIPGEQVDMSALCVNVYSSANQAALTSEAWDGDPSALHWQFRKCPGVTERGTPNTLEGDETHEIVVDLSGFDTIAAYDWFTVEVVPPTGATITVKRILPGQLATKNDLK